MFCHLIIKEELNISSSGISAPGKPEISLGMHPANERRRYIVTTSFIGWAHT